MQHKIPSHYRGPLLNILFLLLLVSPVLFAYLVLALRNLLWTLFGI